MPKLPLPFSTPFFLKIQIIRSKPFNEDLKKPRNKQTHNLWTEKYYNISPINFISKRFCHHLARRYWEIHKKKVIQIFPYHAFSNVFVFIPCEEPFSLFLISTERKGIFKIKLENFMDRASFKGKIKFPRDPKRNHFLLLNFLCWRSSIYS